MTLLACPCRKQERNTTARRCNSCQGVGRRAPCPVRGARSAWWEREPMPGQGRQVVVGLDNGGTAVNATVLDRTGRFLVDRLVETPSRVEEGPAVAIEALSGAFAGVLGLTGVAREAVCAVGLDTPGPASADG